MNRPGPAHPQTFILPSDADLERWARDSAGPGGFFAIIMHARGCAYRSMTEEACPFDPRTQAEAHSRWHFIFDVTRAAIRERFGAVKAGRLRAEDAVPPPIEPAAIKGAA